MFKAINSEYLAPTNGKFKLKDFSTKPQKNAPKKKECKKLLIDQIEILDDLQKRLYAEDCWSVLVVFQAMDAAGKDSTIRACMSGLNPAWCQVFSFKSPSKEELDHDFLWRCYKCLPERGRIGVFNRSYYEECLVVRVHSEILQKQKLPKAIDKKSIWQDRFESIKNFERHLALNGTAIIKFWLNVSREEQHERFLSRLDTPEKNWKFEPRDIEESTHWNKYMKAYEDVVKETSKPWAPWYVIPADSKPYMRYQVAKILAESLEKLNPEFPIVKKDVKAKFDEMREKLIV